MSTIQVGVRFPLDMYEVVKCRAEAEDRSMGNWVMRAVKAYLEAEAKASGDKAR